MKLYKIQRDLSGWRELCLGDHDTKFIVLQVISPHHFPHSRLNPHQGNSWWYCVQTAALKSNVE